MGSEWVCRAWSSSWPGCPSARPALGAACDQDGALCAWDGCCWDVPFGPDEACTDGQWKLHILDQCACGTVESCPYAVIPLGPPDGGVGDDENPPVTSGCGCTVGASSGAQAAFAFVAVVALAARRRRSRWGAR